MRRRCCNCRKLTHNWQRVNGSPWHCYDGCYSTMGFDYRTVDGQPAWEPARIGGRVTGKAWAKSRLRPEYQFLAR